jgi:hypothetical protein
MGGLRARWRVSATEDVAKVLHGPSPAGQRRVARVLKAKALDQGHIGAGTGRPDQGEQVGRLAGDGGNRCDEPVVSMTDIGYGRFRSGAIHRRKAAASALTPACLLSATVSKSPGGLPPSRTPACKAWPSCPAQCMPGIDRSQSPPEHSAVSGVLMPTVGVTVTLCSAGDCTMDWQGFRPVA